MHAATGHTGADGLRAMPKDSSATLRTSWSTRVFWSCAWNCCPSATPLGTVRSYNWPSFGQYADFEKFDSKSLWAAQRRKFFKTAVGARLLAMYHPHSHGPPTSLSLFKTKRPRRPLRQMPTKSPQSRPTAHATADAHVRCLPSPQTHSLGKILKNGSGRQEKSGEKSQLELEK